MTILRESATDAKFSLKIRRNGSYIENKDGATDLDDFVRACEIIEGIDTAGISAQIVLEDSAGLINSLTGSEEWVITVSTGNSDASYAFNAYSIESRARSGNSEAYIVNCVSREYLINESSNIFGSSKAIFKDSLSSKGIVESILQQNIYGGQSGKNIFAEDSKNEHRFIACNWRAFDTIYWVAKRSVRTTSSGTNPQNGYLFWENLMGYHFKSVDSIIKDANEQSYDEDTNIQSGKARLYRYVYEAKKTGDEGTDDQRIDSIVFPDDRNYLKGLRNGTWSGFSIVFDPTKVDESLASNDSKNTQQPYTYNINELWADMEHVKGGENPVESFTDDIKSLIENPKRIKYEFVPHHIYDQKGEKGESGNSQGGQNDSAEKTYGELPYLQAYQYMRMESLKNIRLLVNVPGNLDLFSGYGVEIVIPNTKPEEDKFVVDKKYSGRYIIAALRHKWDSNTLYTEMLLYRDSLPK